jgi:hypothetical protein
VIVPTGTVFFYDGATALGSSTLDNKGSATFGASALSVGQHSISASYAGTSDFEGSTSSPVQVTIMPFTGDFLVGVDPPSADVYMGDSATLQVLTAGTGGFNQKLSLSCSGLPAESSCTFSPDSMNSGSIDGVRGRATLTIQTSPPHKANIAHTTWHFPWQGALTSLAILVLPRRLRRRGILLLVLATVAAVAVIGCGSPGPITGGTPPGTYTVQITATASQLGQTLSHSVMVKLRVKAFN